MSNEAMPQITSDELMMVNTLHINASRWDEYQRALEEILPQARALEACLSLEAGKRLDEPFTVVLSERWRSGVEYVEQVLKLPIYVKYLEATESMYSAPRSVVVLQQL